MPGSRLSCATRLSTEGLNTPPIVPTDLGWNSHVWGQSLV
jgi:hypothetical protein